MDADQKQLRRSLRWGVYDIVERLYTSYFNYWLPADLVEVSDVITTVGDEPEILFLCFGNICRSPMAERYAKITLESKQKRPLIKSAGFVTMEGRKSPDDARQAAREFGVDLSGHRSRFVTKEMIGNADLIFIMDVNNYVRLRYRFPDATNKAFFLGGTQSTTAPDVFIPDPHGNQSISYSSCFQEIKFAIDSLRNKL